MSKELEYANRELQKIGLKAERKAGELLNKKQKFLSNDKEK